MITNLRLQLYSTPPLSEQRPERHAQLGFINLPCPALGSCSCSGHHHHMWRHAALDISSYSTLTRIEMHCYVDIFILDTSVFVCSYRIVWMWILNSILDCILYNDVMTSIHHTSPHITNNAPRMFYLFSGWSSMLLFMSSGNEADHCPEKCVCLYLVIQL